MKDKKDKKDKGIFAEDIQQLLGEDTVLSDKQAADLKRMIRIKFVSHLVFVVLTAFGFVNTMIIEFSSFWEKHRIIFIILSFTSFFAFVGNCIVMLINHIKLKRFVREIEGNAPTDAFLNDSDGFMDENRIIEENDLEGDEMTESSAESGISDGFNE